MTPSRVARVGPLGPKDPLWGTGASHYGQREQLYIYIYNLGDRGQSLLDTKLPMSTRNNKKLQIF